MNGVMRGSGTELDPYLIEDAYDLAKLTLRPQHGIANKYYYKMVNDIDLNVPPYNTSGWTSIENFQGVFDGQGYAIKNMYIDHNSSDTYGTSSLFGYVSINTGETIFKIKNLKLINYNIRADRESYDFGVLFPRITITTSTYFGPEPTFNYNEPFFENIYLEGNVNYVTTRYNAPTPAIAQVRMDFILKGTLFLAKNIHNKNVYKEIYIPHEYRNEWCWGTTLYVVGTKGNSVKIENIIDETVIEKCNKPSLIHCGINDYFYSNGGRYIDVISKNCFMPEGYLQDYKSPIFTKVGESYLKDKSKMDSFNDYVNNKIPWSIFEGSKPTLTINRPFDKEPLDIIRADNTVLGYDYVNNNWIEFKYFTGELYIEFVAKYAISINTIPVEKFRELKEKYTTISIISAFRTCNRLSRNEKEVSLYKDTFNSDDERLIYRREITFEDSEQIKFLI